MFFLNEGREEGALVDLFSAKKYSGFITTTIFSIMTVVSFICSIKHLQTSGYVVLVFSFLISLILVSLPYFAKGHCASVSGVRGFGLR